MKSQNYGIILCIIFSCVPTLYAADFAGALLYETIHTKPKGIPITELFESPTTKNEILSLTKSSKLTRQSVFNKTVMTASVFWPLISVDESTFTIRFTPQIEMFMLQVTPWETSPYQGKITVTSDEENIILTVTLFAKSRYRDEVDSFVGYLKKNLYPKGPTVRLSPSGNMELEFSK